MTTPKVPTKGCCPPSDIDQASLIESVRRFGFSSHGRQLWYPVLPRIVIEGMEIMENASQLHVTTERRYKSSLHAYTMKALNSIKPIDQKLDRPGFDKMTDLVLLLVNGSIITNEELTLMAPFLYHLCGAVKRIDYCFCVIQDVLKSRDWYMNPCLQEYRVMMILFRELVRQSMPKTFASLLSFHGLDDIHLHKIFVGLFFDLIPRMYAIRILDCYMVEGEKVLYRFGFALLSYFKKQIKDMHFKNGAEFWQFVKSYEHFDFEELLAIAFEKHKSALDKIRKPTIFSRNYIAGVRQEARFLIAERSNGSKFTKKDKDLIFADVAFEAVISTWFDNSILRQSSLLTVNEAVRLHSFLRQAKVHPSKFSLGFSTTNDGWSLATLYDKMKNCLPPCILLIRSQQKHAVVGAFLSCLIGPPTGQAVGDNRSFVFRLDGKSAGRFQATLASKPKQTPQQQQQQQVNTPRDGYLTDRTVSSGILSPRAVDEPFDATRFAQEQIARFAPSFLVLGSSTQRVPTNAIKLTSDLMLAYCGPSDTYNNPPMAPDEPFPFPVSSIEVFCIKPAESGLKKLQSTMNINKKSSNGSLRALASVGDGDASGCGDDGMMESPRSNFAEDGLMSKYQSAMDVTTVNADDRKRLSRSRSVSFLPLTRNVLGTFAEFEEAAVEGVVPPGLTPDEAEARRRYLAAGGWRSLDCADDEDDTVILGETREERSRRASVSMCDDDWICCDNNAFLAGLAEFHLTVQGEDTDGDVIDIASLGGIGEFDECDAGVNCDDYLAAGLDIPIDESRADYHQTKLNVQKLEQLIGYVEEKEFLGASVSGQDDYDSEDDEEKEDEQQRESDGFATNQISPRRKREKYPVGRLLIALQQQLATQHKIKNKLKVVIYAFNIVALRFAGASATDSVSAAVLASAPSFARMVSLRLLEIPTAPQPSAPPMHSSSSFYSTASHHHITSRGDRALSSVGELVDVKDRDTTNQSQEETEMETATETAITTPAQPISHTPHQRQQRIQHALMSKVIQTKLQQSKRIMGRRATTSSAIASQRMPLRVASAIFEDGFLGPFGGLDSDEEDDGDDTIALSVVKTDAKDNNNNNNNNKDNTDDDNNKNNNNTNADTKRKKLPKESVQGDVFDLDVDEAGEKRDGEDNNEEKQESKSEENSSANEEDEFPGDDDDEDNDGDDDDDGCDSVYGTNGSMDDMFFAAPVYRSYSNPLPAAQRGIRVRARVAADDSDNDEDADVVEFEPNSSSMSLVGAPFHALHPIADVFVGSNDHGMSMLSLPPLTPRIKLAVSRTSSTRIVGADANTDADANANADVDAGCDVGVSVNAASGGDAVVDEVDEVVMLSARSDSNQVMSETTTLPLPPSIAAHSRSSTPIPTATTTTATDAVIAAVDVITITQPVVSEVVEKQFTDNLFEL